MKGFNLMTALFNHMRNSPLPGTELFLSPIKKPVFSSFEIEIESMTNYAFLDNLQKIKRLQKDKYSVNICFTLTSTYFYTAPTFSYVLSLLTLSSLTVEDSKHKIYHIVS